MADGWRPLLIDLREPWECELARLPENTFETAYIPFPQLPAALPELPTDRPLLFLCHHGIRSWHAACMTFQYRQAPSPRDIVNLAGGIDAWAREIDPDMARY